MPQVVDWLCRNGVLALSAILALYLLHAAGLEFGAPLLQMLAQESAILGVVTVGALVVFHGGGYDLSIGAVFALALVTLVTLVDAGYGVLGVALVLLGGVFAGTLNGILVAALRASVLVSAVLAVGWREVATAMAGAYPLAPNAMSGQSMRWISWQTVGGVSWSFLVFLVASVALGWVFSRTAVGRRITAIGLDDRRAGMAGVRVPLHRVGCYAAGGLAAALGAIAYFSLLSTGNAQTGEMLPFDALAAIVIGNGGLHRGRPAPLRVGAAVVCLTALYTAAPAVMQSPRSALVVVVLLIAAALLGQWRRPQPV